MGAEGVPRAAELALAAVPEGGLVGDHGEGGEDARDDGVSSEVGGEGDQDAVEDVVHQREPPGELRHLPDPRGAGAKVTSKRSPSSDSTTRRRSSARRRKSNHASAIAIGDATRWNGEQPRTDARQRLMIPV